MIEQDRPMFPILGTKALIDWQLVADHNKQAKENHYQSVQQLASRGGLSWDELHAVLHNRKWQKMDANTAMIECRALEAKYLGTEAITPILEREAATTARYDAALASKDAEIALLRVVALRAHIAINSMLVGIGVFNDRKIDRHVPIEGAVITELQKAGQALHQALAEWKAP